MKGKVNTLVQIQTAEDLIKLVEEYITQVAST